MYSSRIDSAQWKTAGSIVAGFGVQIRLLPQALGWRFGDAADAARMMAHCRGRLIRGTLLAHVANVSIPDSSGKIASFTIDSTGSSVGLSVFGLWILAKVGLASKNSSNRPRIFLSVPPPYDRQPHKHAAENWVFGCLQCWENTGIRAFRLYVSHIVCFDFRFTFITLRLGRLVARTRNTILCALSEWLTACTHSQFVRINFHIAPLKSSFSPVLLFSDSIIASRWPTILHYGPYETRSNNTVKDVNIHQNSIPPNNNTRQHTHTHTQTHARART